MCCFNFGIYGRLGVGAHAGEARPGRPPPVSPKLPRSGCFSGLSNIHTWPSIHSQPAQTALQPPETDKRPPHCVTAGAALQVRLWRACAAHLRACACVARVCACNLARARGRGGRGGVRPTTNPTSPARDFLPPPPRRLPLAHAVYRTRIGTSASGWPGWPRGGPRLACPARVTHRAQVPSLTAALPPLRLLTCVPASLVPCGHSSTP